MSNLTIDASPLFGGGKAATGTDVIRVKITDINMPFWHMVGFFIKASLAMIPVILVFMFLNAVLFGMIAGMLTRR